MKYINQNLDILNLDSENLICLNKVIEILEVNNTILRIFLGGSHAQGTNDINSDFDIKIIYSVKDNSKFYSLSRNLSDVNGVDKNHINHKVINLYYNIEDFNIRKKSEKNLELSVNHQLIDDFKQPSSIVDVFKFSPNKNVKLKIDIECYEIGHFMSMIYKQNIHAIMYLYSNETILYNSPILDILESEKHKLHSVSSLYDSVVNYADSQFQKSSNEDRFINRSPFEFFKEIQNVEFIFQHYIYTPDVNNIKFYYEDINKNICSFCVCEDKKLDLTQNTFIETENSYYYLDSKVKLFKLEVKSPLDFSIVINKQNILKKLYKFITKIKHISSIKEFVEIYGNIFNSIKTDKLSDVISSLKYSASRIDKTDIYCLYDSKFNTLISENNINYKSDYKTVNIPKGKKSILIFSYKKEIYEKYVKTLTDYVKWIRLKNESRFKVDISINTKNLAHLVSNLQIYKKYVLNNVFEPKVDDPNYILNIKRGNFNLEDVMDYVNQLKIDISSNLKFENSKLELYYIINMLLTKIRIDDREEKTD